MLTIDIEFNLIYPRAVVIFEFYAREFFKFGIGANYLDGAFVALPNWHSGSPETVAGKIPIWGSFDVFSETAMLEVSWEPVDVFVFGEHQGLLTLDIKEPARKCAIHNTFFTAGIEGVFMLDVFYFFDYLDFFETLSNDLVHTPSVNFVIFVWLDAGDEETLIGAFEIESIVIEDIY